MTIEEYFGKWSSVVPVKEAHDTLNTVLNIMKKPICPSPRDIFRAFEVCPYDNLKVVVIGQDCYPDMFNGKPVATGIAFANRADTPADRLSPSLKILKESFIGFPDDERHVNFDPTLEEISRQGVLFINTALTCEMGKPGSHMLLWRPFTISLLKNLSKKKTSIVYVLLGTEAQSFRDYIDIKYNYVLCDKHPAYYARMKMSMPPAIWKSVNDIIRSINGKEEEIKWFREEDTFSEGQCKEDKEQKSEERDYPSI